MSDPSNPTDMRMFAEGVENSSIALYQAGLQRLNAGSLNEAIGLLGRAVALDASNPQTQLALGVALQRAGRHADALALLERARKSLRNDPSPFLYVSISMLALGKAEAALLAASDACALSSHLPHAQLAYGQALMALDDPVRAEQAFTAALQRAPQWAEAWFLCGAARRLQGSTEGAKAAMREALRLAPGHAAAKDSLAVIERVDAEAAEKPLAVSGISRDLCDQRAPSDKTVVLTAWRPKSPAASVGLAVEYLSRKPAFAKLPFGEWSQVLFYQVAREHFFFVIDKDRRICGFLGWALTDQKFAELWMGGRSGLRNEECLDGDCVVVNAWSADTVNVNGFIRDAMRKLFANRRAIYFKRHYPDGRERASRLAIPTHKKNGA